MLLIQGAAGPEAGCDFERHAANVATSLGFGKSEPMRSESGRRDALNNAASPELRSLAFAQGAASQKARTRLPFQ
jgi:hypothetical protein